MEINNVETLEEARAEILRLNEALTESETARQTLVNTNADLTEEIGKVRDLNQQYYLKLIAQDNDTGDDEEEPEIMTCEEFARTLNI